MQKIILILILLTLPYTANAEIVYKGGNGSSIKNAIIIKGAKTSLDGVPAESKWIKENKPSYTKNRQSLVNTQDGSFYDVIEIISPKGKKEEIYFDITDFFVNNDL